MANTINNIYFSNTFGQLVVTTDQMVNSWRYLGFQDWNKDSGTFKISSPGIGFDATTKSVFRGETTVEGVGSSLYVQNNAEVNKILSLTGVANTVTLYSNGSSIFSGGFNDYSSYLTSIGYQNANNRYAVISTGKLLFANSVDILQTANVDLIQANNEIIYYNLSGNTAQFSGNVTVGNLVSNNYIYAANNISTAKHLFVASNSHVIGLSYTETLQANTSANTRYLSVTDNAFANYLQANSNIKTDVAVANTRVVTALVQANNAVLSNTVSANSLVITPTLEATSNLFTSYAQANTRVVTALVQANNAVLSNTVSANSLVTAPTVHGSSNVYTNFAQANTRIVTGILQANTNIFTTAIVANSVIVTPTLQASSNVYTTYLKSNSSILTDILESQSRIITDTSQANSRIITSLLQANTSVITNVLLANSNVTTTIINANTNVITNDILANTRLVTTVVQANNTVVSNTVSANSLVTAPTLNATSNVFTDYAQANTRFVTALIQANNTVLSNTVSANSLVIVPTIEATSNLFTNYAQANTRVVTGILQANTNIFTSSIVSNTTIVTALIQANNTVLSNTVSANSLVTTLTIHGSSNVYTNYAQANTRFVTALIQANNTVLSNTVSANSLVRVPTLEATNNVYTDYFQANTRFVTALIQANNTVLSNTVSANSLVTTITIHGSSNVFTNILQANSVANTQNLSVTQKVFAGDIVSNTNISIANNANTSNLYATNIVQAKSVGYLDNSSNPSVDNIYSKEALFNNASIVSNMVVGGSLRVFGATQYEGKSIQLSSNTPSWWSNSIPSEIVVNRKLDDANGIWYSSNSDAALSWSDLSLRWRAIDVPNSTANSRTYTNLLLELDIADDFVNSSSVRVPSSRVHSLTRLHANSSFEQANAAFNWANSSITIGTTPVYLNRTNTVIGGISTLSVTGTTLSNFVVANTNLNSVGVISNTLQANTSANTQNLSVTQKVFSRDLQANNNLFVTSEANVNNKLIVSGSTGQIDIKPSTTNIRIWDHDNSNYHQIVSGNTTANYDLILASGNTTLVTGTMVPTSLTITSSGGIATDATTNLSINRQFQLTGQARSLHDLSTSGFFVRTSGGTIVSRTFEISGLGLSVANTDGSAGNPTLILNASSTSVANNVVIRDSSGNFSAGTITAALNGNASTATNATTATTLQTARTINGVSFNGSVDIIITSNTTNSLSASTYLVGSAFDGSAATTWAVDATSANTVSKVVARDVSGNFSAGTITATLSGNASTATTLQNARTINGVSFNGSADITITASTPNSLSASTYLVGSAFNGSSAVSWSVDATSANTVSKVVARDVSGNFSAGTITATLSGNATSANKVNTILTRGSYLTGSNFDGSAATTWAVDATSANTVSKVVARDVSGNFSAGTITATLSGNASTATTLQNARTINGVSFNGSADITITASTPNSLSASTYLVGSAFNGSSAVSWAVDATNLNTANKVVARDASGNFSAGTITAALSGNATSANKVNNILSIGSYLTGSNFDGSAATTWAVDATNLNTANKVVARDASGNFSAGTITAALSGNATSATSATTATNLSGGSVSATSGSFSSTLSSSSRITAAGSQLTTSIATATTGLGGLEITGGGSTNVAIMAFNRPGVYAAYFGIGNNNRFQVGGWSMGAAAYDVVINDSGTYGINISGNATTATTLQTARTINGVSFNGSANIIITSNTTNSLTRGSYLTGSNFDGSAATTWAVDATSANTVSKIVARDASGNFSAGTITATLSGTANNIRDYTINQNLGTTNSPSFAALSTTGNITAGGNVVANSDRKLKTNITTVENALDKVLSLRGVNYEKIADGSKGIGVVAQEIQEILPEVVVEGNDGILSVAYGNIVGVLIEAIKEQQKQIEDLKSKIGN